MSSFFIRALSFSFLVSSISAIALDVTDYNSILSASALVAHGVQELYTGNQTGGLPGKWPPPYYWWESGGAWGSMMHYWASTNDTSYNDIMMDALVSQLGPNYDFLRVEEIADTGNDDQAFWASVAMAAAEYGFPDPPAPAPSWLNIVENCWAEYVSRWNTTNCGGGLKCKVTT